MEVTQLTVGMDYVSANGIVLSTEKRVAIQTSLVLLKNAEKFKHITYWGKIQGISSDYCIAQGYGSDPFARKSFMRSVGNPGRGRRARQHRPHLGLHDGSVDCIKWAQLPEAHPVLVKAAASIRTRFTGNPSHEYTVKEAGPAADEARPELPAEVLFPRCCPGVVPGAGRAGRQLGMHVHRRWLHYARKKPRPMATPSSQPR
jgi:hypothetical protein